MGSRGSRARWPSAPPRVRMEPASRLRSTRAELASPPGIACSCPKRCRRSTRSPCVIDVALVASVVGPGSGSRSGSPSAARSCHGSSRGRPLGRQVGPGGHPGLVGGAGRGPEAFLVATRGDGPAPAGGTIAFNPAEMMTASAFQNATVLVVIPLLLWLTCAGAAPRLGLARGGRAGRSCKGWSPGRSPRRWFTG